MFTTQHYRKLAQVLKDVRNDIADDNTDIEFAIDRVESAMTEMLASDNERFDRDSFKAAAKRDS